MFSISNTYKGGVVRPPQYLWRGLCLDSVCFDINSVRIW